MRVLTGIYARLVRVVTSLLSESSVIDFLLLVFSTNGLTTELRKVPPMKLLVLVIDFWTSTLVDLIPKEGCLT